jgi:hypothetical protein
LLDSTSGMAGFATLETGKETGVKGVTGQQFWDHQRLSNSCTVDVTDYT